MHLQVHIVRFVSIKMQMGAKTEMNRILKEQHETDKKQK